MANEDGWETIAQGGSLFDQLEGGGGGSSSRPAGSAGGGFQFGLPPFIPIRQLTANLNVAAGSPEAPADTTTEREMPFRGWVANIQVEWEQGTNQLTGFQMRVGGAARPGGVIVPLDPQDQYIALNASDRTFWLWIPAAAGQKFTFTAQNRDGEGHSIPFVMNVVRLTDFLEESVPPEVLPPEQPVQPPDDDES